MIAEVQTYLSLMMNSSVGYLVMVLGVVQTLMHSIKSLRELRRLMIDLLPVLNLILGIDLSLQMV